MSLLGLVKYFLQKDVTAKEVLPIVSFMLSVKDPELLHEMVGSQFNPFIWRQIVVVDIKHH